MDEPDDTPYRPRPLDTSAVVMPPELEDLVERLAENVHEVYAAGRIAEGWRHGPRRDDARRENPTLVPYAALPESEKAYDRATVTATIKAILAMGYRIERR